MNFEFLICVFASLFTGFVISLPVNGPQSLQFSEDSPYKYASDQLYVFGGRDGVHKFLSYASQFNSSTGEWDSVNEMSIAKNAGCGVAIGTKIYLFGGENNKILNTAEVYDCETGTYRSYRALSSNIPRKGCGAAVLNGFIYVVGGNDGSKILSSVVRYNIRTSRRENVTSLHVARYGLQLVELEGRLYAIGGASTTEATNVVEMFDPSIGRWSEVARTQYAHHYSGATVHEGKLFVRSHLGFEMYSPDTDQWKTLAPLDNMEGSSLVSMNGKLWSVGGGSRSDMVGTKSLFAYNTATNIWNKRIDLDVGRMFHLSFVVNH